MNQLIPFLDWLYDGPGNFFKFLGFVFTIWVFIAGLMALWDERKQ